MTEKSEAALNVCMMEHSAIPCDMVFLAAKFSATTCLSKASASRIKYLDAVLSTLEERKIDTADKFQQFQSEYQKGSKKETWECSEEFRREYDFDKLEEQLLNSNDGVGE